MKNVLIVTYGLNEGGIEWALIEMLKNIDYNLYHVDLILNNKKATACLNQVPSQVNVFFKEIKSPKQLLIQNIKKLKFAEIWKVLRARAKANSNIINEMIINDMLSHITEMPIQKEYDFAIAYHSELQMKFITNIKAKKRIAFIHNFYNIQDSYKYLELFKKMDLICCVSQKAKEKLIKDNPCLREKTVVMLSMINNEIIKQKSNNIVNFDKEYKGVKILTVGRLDPFKGYELAIETLKKLIENNYEVKWYAIGGGIYKKKLEKIIIDNNLQKRFIFLGFKKNPYPYMKECDIYVQPSIGETYCIATAEAKTLNKPIVRTNTSGAEEQFKNMENGIIVDISVDGLYDGITKYLDDKVLKNKIVANLKKENKDSNHIDQIAEIEKILNELR